MDLPEAAGACADQGRGRDREATRQRILDSARELFTNEGYAQVSSRRIAAQAGVNVSLINRYFGAKRGLLAEVIAEDARFPGIVEGDPATLPHRLAEHTVQRVKGKGTPMQHALERFAGDPDLQSIYEERLKNAAIGPLADYLGGPDARVRASLAISMLLGMGLVQRLEGASALVEYDEGELIGRLTRIITVCLEEFRA